MIWSKKRLNEKIQILVYLCLLSSFTLLRIILNLTINWARILFHTYFSILSLNFRSIEIQEGLTIQISKCNTNFIFWFVDFLFREDSFSHNTRIFNNLFFLGFLILRESLIDNLLLLNNLDFYLVQITFFLLGQRSTTNLSRYNWPCGIFAYFRFLFHYKKWIQVLL
jgi:hypothetical protein